MVVEFVINDVYVHLHYLIYIMRTVWDGWNGGITTGRLKIPNFRTANDATLTASNVIEMRQLLKKELEDKIKSHGLEINNGEI